MPGGKTERGMQTGWTRPAILDTRWKEPQAYPQRYRALSSIQKARKALGAKLLPQHVPFTYGEMGFVDKPRVGRPPTGISAKRQSKLLAKMLAKTPVPPSTKMPEEEVTALLAEPTTLAMRTRNSAPWATTSNLQSV
jgi:hypothetical protein